MLEKVKEHYDYLRGRGYEVVFTALQGSQNYGLDEYSDVDTKSMVLPKFADFVAAKQPISAVDDKYTRKVLINLKKQKDPDGNLLSCEKAVELMNFYVDRIKEMKDEIVNDWEIRTDAYVGNFLEDIKVKALKQFFIEELV